MVTPPPPPPAGGRPSQPGEPGDSAALAGLSGLGAEVEQLAHTVHRLATLPQRVEELARIVTSLADTTRPSAVERSDGGELVLSWLDLDGSPAAARAILTDLTAWMSRILLRYPDAANALPECWAWHPDIVEELLWLRQTWTAAYRTPGASPGMAGDWHDRYRTGVVHRIKASAGTCSIENHWPGGDHRKAAPAPLPEQVLDAVADWWAGSRDEPPPVQLDTVRPNGSRR